MLVSCICLSFVQACWWAASGARIQGAFGCFFHASLGTGSLAKS